MSINFGKKRISSAARYNANSQYELPPYVLARFPKLKNDRGSEAFAWAVHDIQFGNLGFRDIHVDGMLGYKTYTELLRLCKPVNSQYVIRHGQRITLPNRSQYRVFAFDDPVRGKDLHRFGHFSLRRELMTAVCLHWGGLDAEHCFNVFASEQRKVSSHFLIGKNANGQVEVFQTIDIAHAAWHAGHINQWTLGIDICQSPNPQWKDYYMVTKRGLYDIEKVDNPTNRGPKKILTLDPVLEEGARQFITDLTDALDLPRICPPTHDVYATEDLKKYTLIGHHHSNERKYDLACWWDRLLINDIAPQPLCSKIEDKDGIDTDLV